MDAAPMAVHYPSHIRRVVRGPKGLGFLWWGGSESADEDIYGDYDYLFDYGGNYGGDWGGWDASIFDLGLPNWQDTREFGGYYVDPNTGAFLFTDNTRLPSQTGTGTYGTPSDNWQGLLDWWRDLTSGGYTPNVPLPGPEPNTSTLPPFSGYCPPNTYCGNYPVCSECLPLDNSRAAKAAAAAHKAAQAAAQKAAAQKQQQQQPCPPNTGLVKNAAGKCVCPAPYQFSKTYGKCVMASQLTAKDKEDAQAPDWLKWAIAAGIVVVGVKVLQGGKGK